MTYSVLVVDDHPLLRRALCSVIEDEADLEVAAEAGNGEEAVSLVQSHHPDMIVMDLLMPVMDGVQAIRKIRSIQPGARILALSSTTEDARILEAIQAGAQGFLSKETQPPEILNAIRLVAQGEFFLTRELTQKLLLGAGPANQPVLRSAKGLPDERVDFLTAREKEILRLMADGLSNRGIAQKLVLSEATIRSHVYHILNKLGLENRNQAIVYALRKQPVLQAQRII